MGAGLMRVSEAAMWLIAWRRGGREGWALRKAVHEELSVPGHHHC